MVPLAQGHAPGRGKGSGRGHPCTVDTFLVLVKFYIKFFIPRHVNSGRVLWFHIGHPYVCLYVLSVVRLAVRLSIFRFRIIT